MLFLWWLEVGVGCISMMLDLNEFLFFCISIGSCVVVGGIWVVCLFEVDVIFEWIVIVFLLMKVFVYVVVYCGFFGSFRGYFLCYIFSFYFYEFFRGVVIW